MPPAYGNGTLHVVADVARTTGKTRRAVQRALDLMLEVQGYQAMLLVIDGELAVAIDGPNRLPAWLEAEIEQHYDELRELVGPIGRATRRPLADDAKAQLH